MAIPENCVICPQCGGDGRMVIGENLVTMDMARDAGDESLAGSHHSYEMGECSLCHGDGVVPVK